MTDRSRPETRSRRGTPIAVSPLEHWAQGAVNVVIEPLRRWRPASGTPDITSATATGGSMIRLPTEEPSRSHGSRLPRAGGSRLRPSAGDAHDEGCRSRLFVSRPRMSENGAHEGLASTASNQLVDPAPIVRGGATSAQRHAKASVGGQTCQPVPPRPGGPGPIIRKKETRA